MARKKGSRQLQLTRIGVNIPTIVKKFVLEHIKGQNPSYMNESDFYRDAIIEKINRDYPELASEIRQGS